MYTTITVFLLALFLCFAFTSLFYKWHFQYWKTRKMPHFSPKIPFGNVNNPIGNKQHLGVQVKEYYKMMKNARVKHMGLYIIIKPAFLTTDLDVIKNFLVKDFQYFTDRDLFSNGKDDPLSANLVRLNGEKWRKLRNKLTPTFTSGKLKGMFKILVNCQKHLQEVLDHEYEKQEPINIKEVLTGFTMDIIGSCAFGLDLKTIKDSNSPFRVHSRAIFADPGIWEILKLPILEIFPGLAKLLKIKLISGATTDFFIDTVKRTIDFREKTQFVRNDFLQLLLQMKNSSNEEDRLTLNEIAAQCYIFFLGGYETASATMSFALYHLGKNLEMQRKLSNEVSTVLDRFGGEITYDALNEMTYMNQVVEETLRLYPSFPVINRKCVKDYNIPGTDLILEKGVQVVIPVMAIHYDEDYYPDPEKFDPERFNEGNKASRKNFTYIPFGEGPRICIGMRFALMQIKVGLTTLLRKYEFTVSSKTQEPLKLQGNTATLVADGDIWLSARRSNSLY